MICLVGSVKHSTEIPGVVLFPQDGPPKLLSLVRKSKKFTDLRMRIPARSMGANRLLVVAWGSAGRSLVQVSASIAVLYGVCCASAAICYREREGARGSERRGLVICRCVECRERERCAISARNRGVWSFAGAWSA